MAGRFDSGVRWYTEARLQLPVYFPEDDVRCARCRFMRKDSCDRSVCAITHDLIVSEQLINASCPLMFPEGGEDGDLQRQSTPQP